MVTLVQSASHPHYILESTDYSPINSVVQSELVAPLCDDLEGIGRVLAAVDTTDGDVVGEAVHIAGEVELDLRVAVDADVDEVRDSDGLDGARGGRGSGEAGEEGGGGEELHVDVWVD